MTATRRNGREWALQMLCSLDLNPEDLSNDVLAEHWRLLEEEERIALEERAVGSHKILLDTSASVRARLEEMRAFAEERVKGVWSSRKQLDETLEKYLENWSMYRLGTIERNVLRLGAWEILNCPAIPAPIIVNEAVDLAKFFSVRASGRFVNGVLDKLAKAHAKELGEGTFVPGE